RVLIVDDDEQVCRAARLALNELARCDAVHDVASALHALHDKAYDVVLADIGLPGASGFALLDALKLRWPQPRAIMMTASGELGRVKEALARGAAGYLLKPVRVADLRISVLGALAARGSAEHEAQTNRNHVVDALSDVVAAATTTVCTVVDFEQQ